jgi:hypothetical protein
MSDQPLKIDQIVYFRQAKGSTIPGSPLVKFPGFAFGVLMGMVPYMGPDIQDPNDLFRLLGGVGLVKFEDVGEFLGPELMASVIQKFREKYALTEEEKKPPPPPILNAAGLPFKTGLN